MVVFGIFPPEYPEKDVFKDIAMRVTRQICTSDSRNVGKTYQHCLNSTLVQR